MLDGLLVLSDAQAVAGAADATVYSTAQRIGTLGQGYQTGAVIAKVQTDFTGAGSLQAVLQHADDDGDGSPDTWSDALAGPVVASAALLQGAKLLNVGLPADMKEHVRIAYKITVDTQADGKVDGRFDLAPETDPVNNS